MFVNHVNDFILLTAMMVDIPNILQLLSLLGLYIHELFLGFVFQKMQNSRFRNIITLVEKLFVKVFHAY